jgi:uncharacterized protein
MIQGKTAYKYLLDLFREREFPGCTVFRSIAGYGHRKKIRTMNVVRLSMDMPIIIDVVDGESRIISVIPELEKLVQHGLIIIQDVTIVRKEKEPHTCQETEDTSGSS